MKNILSLFLLIASVQISFAQTDTVQTNKNIFTIVEKMPSWKGCEGIQREAEKSACTYESIMNYLMNEIKYPETSRNKRIEGQVYINFIINESGNVTDPEIVKGVSPDIDEEAIRVVVNMPDWNPGMNEGLPVPVQYILPIKFTLANKK